MCLREKDTIAAISRWFSWKEIEQKYRFSVCPVCVSLYEVRRYSFRNNSGRKSNNVDNYLHLLVYYYLTSIPEIMLIKDNTNNESGNDPRF